MLDVIEEPSLKQKIHEALEIESNSISNPDGEDIDLSDSLKKQIKVRNVADTIADHFSKALVNHSDIKSSELSYGSGDTGRQSQLYFEPYDSVSKAELLVIAEKLNILLEEIFPTDYYLGIRHGFTIDEDGYPVETDSFSLFLVYNVRSHGGPSKPAGEKTIVL